MGKEFKDGVWIMTREDNTADSERHTERDDPLFEVMQPIFQGNQTQVDLESLASVLKIKPEDVFMYMHENYGYVCIGTGENPAMNETLSDIEKIDRQKAIEQALELEKLPHILINGKYMGVEESSYFIPFMNREIGLSKILQGDIVKKIEKIAHAHNQDSLLICQTGYACYLYTSGMQKGNVITGKTAVVYPGKQLLPDDCYSLFLNSDNIGNIGFTCGLNFNRVYQSVEEYAAEENNNLQKHYHDFTTECLAEENEAAKNKKLVILLRGTDGYNVYASELKRWLAEAGIKAGIVGTDANIAKVNEEVANDNLIQGPKAGWQWPQIRNEFIKRNKEIYASLLNSHGIDVIIYADMNTLVEYMEPYAYAATQQGHDLMIVVVNSFVFEPNRSDYIERLCNLYGSYMGRHVGNFKSEKGQINADSLKIGDIMIDQLKNCSVDNLVKQVSKRHSDNRDQISASALTKGLAGVMFTQGEVSQGQETLHNNEKMTEYSQTNTGL